MQLGRPDEEVGRRKNLTNGSRVLQAVASRSEQFGFKRWRSTDHVHTLTYINAPSSPNPLPTFPLLVEEDEGIGGHPPRSS